MLFEGAVSLSGYAWPKARRLDGERSSKLPRCASSSYTVREIEYLSRARPDSYALDSDWPVEAGGFEPLHFRIGIREDSQPGAAGFELTHLN